MNWIAPPGLPPAEFLAVWTLLLVNILTPGPNVLNTIALAIGSGRRAGMGAALGVGLGIGMWCLGSSLGLAALLAAMPAARQILTLIAAALLLWFASRYLARAREGLAARRSGREVALAGRGGQGLWSGFVRALGINAANPKAMTTWLAVLAVFPVARATAGDLALLTAGACVLSLAIHTGYALAFSTPVAARAYLRAAPVINLGVALFFAGFALALAWSAGLPV